MSLWSWQFWQPLWPAVFVWLCIALPSLAWNYPRIQDGELLGKLPWWFRVIGWSVAHCWPYSKVARVSVRFAQWEAERAEVRREARCRACSATSWDLEHALAHFPAEDDRWQQLWFTPPRFATPEEADRWLAAREATGDPCWE